MADIGDDGGEEDDDCDEVEEVPWEEMVVFPELVVEMVAS